MTGVTIWPARSERSAVQRTQRRPDRQAGLVHAQREGNKARDPQARERAAVVIPAGNAGRRTQDGGSTRSTTGRPAPRDTPYPAGLCTDRRLVTNTSRDPKRTETNLEAVSRDSRVSRTFARLLLMNTARKPVETVKNSPRPALTVNVEIDPLVEVVRRHVKLSPQAIRLIKGDFARLFQTPTVRGSIKTPASKLEASTDQVLTTQEAADLVGVSRPYIVARIEAGDIPLHQQVGNQRRVLKSAVQAWHRREQVHRRRAIGQLGVDLDSEIFAD